MKRFTFPLERVLAWRATELRLAEARMEQLQTSLALVESQAREIRESETAYHREVVGRRQFDSSEFERLDQFRRYVAQEQIRLTKLRERFAAEVDTQRKEVHTKRRNLELLERLKLRRRAEWQAESDKELLALAEESFTAKFARELRDE